MKRQNAEAGDDWLKERPGRWPAVELRRAALLAEALLIIDATKQYGLIEGGPKIDAERCWRVIQAAKGRRIVVSRNEAMEEAVRVVDAVNRGAWR